MTLTVALTLGFISLYHLSKPGLWWKEKVFNLSMKTRSSVVSFLCTLLLCPGCLSFWIAGGVYLIQDYMPVWLIGMVISSAVVHLSMALYYEITTME